LWFEKRLKSGAIRFFLFNKTLEMEAKVNNPLIVRCPNCNGEEGFDIEKQRYECSHCGHITEKAQQKLEFRNWRKLQHNKVRSDIGKLKLFRCPACGAQTMAPVDEAVAKCPFCQNSLIDADFSGAVMPEVILPFKLTYDEAKSRLEKWLGSNSLSPAAKSIRNNMDRFAGCYLPYHVVRGACDGNMSIADQAGIGHNYPFRAYIKSMAVNASCGLDNIFLDGIEPFDFDETREFEYGFLNGQRAKVQNVGSKNLEKRISDETSTELYHTLSKDVHTKEVSVLMGDNETETIAALMPVYFLKCDNGVAVAVNGQSGKISVFTGKNKNLTRFWWLGPVAVAIVLAVVISILGDDVSLGFAVSLVIGIILLVVAHQRHHDEIVPDVIISPKDKESHNGTRAVFMKDFGDGKIPVKIKFFTAWRIIKIAIAAVIIIFLPYLIALPIQLLMEKPISDINLLYGAAWFIIPVLFTVLGLTGMGKAMLYGYPMYYEVLPDGKTKRVKIKKDTSESTTKNIFGFLRTKVGCLLVCIALFLLVGSIGAMLSADDEESAEAVEEVIQSE